MHAISVGEVLWDVVGSEEHLGGAPFNFAAHLSRLGHAVSFVSSVGQDSRGDRVLDRMRDLGLSSRYVARNAAYPTGVASVTVDDRGQPTFVIRHPAAYDFPQLSAQQTAELGSSSPAFIYFGTLCQMSRQARKLLFDLLELLPRASRFYDVNLRPNSYEPELVRELMQRANVIKLNEDEVGSISAAFDWPRYSLEEFCRTGVNEFGWEVACITRGAQGCVVWMDDQYIAAEGYGIAVHDTIGAGDAFSAALVHGLANRWSPNEIADFANRVGALVASRSGAIPSWTVEEAVGLRR
jgi:fructokinase